MCGDRVHCATVSTSEAIPAFVIEADCVAVDRAVHDVNPDLITVTCGSYRRGRLQVGDVDILITDPRSDDDPHYLPLIVSR